MQYFLSGENKDGVNYTRASTSRDGDRDKNAIFSTWREQRWRYLLQNLLEETEIENKNAIFSIWREQRWRYLY
jgi:hypothetical protein